MRDANLKMNVPEAKDKRQPTPPLSVSVPTLQIEILSDFISNVKNRPTSAHTKSLFVLTSYQSPLHQIILILTVSHKHRCLLPFSHFCLEILRRLVGEPVFGSRVSCLPVDAPPRAIFHSLLLLGSQQAPEQQHTRQRYSSEIGASLGFCIFRQSLLTFDHSE